MKLRSLASWLQRFTVILLVITEVEAQTSGLVPETPYWSSISPKGSTCT